VDKIIDFLLLTEPNTRYVVLGSILLGASSAIVGCFTFLQKRALVGDAVAHSVLPGVCGAFLMAGTKNPLFLILGAFVSGWLSIICMNLITRYSKLKEDTAVALILSVFFGFGVMLLTYIQQSGNASQSGLESFLFGKAAALVGSDVWVFGGLAALMLLLVGLFYKEFIIVIFHKNFAQTIGLPIVAIEILLTTLTVLAVVVGIQSVGVVLMAAMLVTPAAAARFWTDKLHYMLFISAGFGALAAIGGAFVSYIQTQMPTGPWIVLVASAIAMFSFFFAPNKGIVARRRRQYLYKKQILEENILKAIYHDIEKSETKKTISSLEDIGIQRHFKPILLKNTLQKLTRRQFIEKNKNGWQLTEKGNIKAKRLVKLHRLWELYLTEFVRLAPDHVHEAAEALEHILTPEIEAQLEARLKYPQKDPHDRDIPY
jgi:manganese/zinc/iron transport system permease protein